MASSETFTSVTSNLMGGESDIVTKSVTIGSGNLVANTVLGQVTSTGEYVQCVSTLVNGEEVPAAILVVDANASVASMSAPVFVGGVFNPDELVWDASITAVGKLTAFSGTNITLTNVL